MVRLCDGDVISRFLHCRCDGAIMRVQYAISDIVTLSDIYAVLNKTLDLVPGTAYHSKIKR